MAVTLKGLAAVWGVNGLSFTGVVISSTVGRIQSFSGTRDAEIAYLENEFGETNGAAYFNKKLTAEISVIPTDAAAVATAHTNLAAMIPEPGTLITLVDSNSTTNPFETTNAAKFMVTSSRMSRTNRAFGVIDLTIEQFEANDLAAFTATAS